MGGLFISYRRQDTADWAGRLREDLARRYGAERVFLDVTDLAPGASWTAALHEAVASCEAMLVLIGPRWLGARDPNGRRRLDDPGDFIRSEIATALRLAKHVVPVLVGGAVIPAPSTLPPDLHGLAMLQACPLTDERWSADLAALLGVLDPILGGARATPVPPTPAEERVPARPLPFLARLALALDVLMGRDVREAPARTPRVPEGPSPDGAGDHEVFVSYSREDRAFVEDVVRELELRGRRCWFAQRDIPPGVPSWAEPIVTAIARSRLVLVLLTAHSIQSVDVLREVTLAADEKIPLLPVSLDPSPLSPGLRYFFVAGQRLELAGSTAAAQVQRIVPAVDRQLLVAPAQPRSPSIAGA